ncbi:MAG: restriction endonuclease, partial [Bacteroidota bacterium]|nr:restriction endonuclease [Bacteroidota bacterium]
MILDYEYFKQCLNERLFQNSYSDLIRKIAENPERYVGLFRPTKAKTKLIQNITQSHEIRFGDALEFIFEKYFESTGFELRNKRILFNEKELNIDLLFSKENSLYMIEQKVRDDHDSTKKVGQFNNFENK